MRWPPRHTGGGRPRSLTDAPADIKQRRCQLPLDRHVIWFHFCEWRDKGPRSIEQPPGFRKIVVVDVQQRQVVAGADERQDRLSIVCGVGDTVSKRSIAFRKPSLASPADPVNFLMTATRT